MRYLNETQRQSNVTAYCGFLDSAKKLYPHLTVKIKERSVEEYMELQKEGEGQPVRSWKPQTQKPFIAPELTLEEQIERSKKILADPDMEPIHGNVRDNMYERIKQLEARNKLESDDVQF